MPVALTNFTETTNKVLDHAAVVVHAVADEVFLVVAAVDIKAPDVAPLAIAVFRHADAERRHCGTVFNVTRDVTALLSEAVVVLPVVEGKRGIAHRAYDRAQGVDCAVGQRPRSVQCSSGRLAVAGRPLAIAHQSVYETHLTVTRHGRLSAADAGGIAGKRANFRKTGKNCDVVPALRSFCQIMAI